MSGDQAIRAAIDRVIGVFTKRPETARNTDVGRAVVSDGLRAEFASGDHRVVVDMPEAVGGGGAGPTPGFYARAGISSCVAIGIKLTAVRLGVALRNVTVDVETDFDDAALLGVGESSAAPLQTRLAIAVDADSTEQEIETLVAEALSRDPWYLALRDSQYVTHQVSVRPA